MKDFHVLCAKQMHLHQFIFILVHSLICTLQTLVEFFHTKMSCDYKNLKRVFDKIQHSLDILNVKKTTVKIKTRLQCN